MRFSVSLDPGAPPEVVEVEGDRLEAERWTLHRFDAGGSYPCALAFRARARPVRFFAWGPAQSV